MGLQSKKRNKKMQIFISGKTQVSKEEDESFEERCCNKRNLHKINGHHPFINTIFCLFLALSISACSSKTTLESISISSNTDISDVNQDIILNIETDPKDFDLSGIKIITSDDTIVKGDEISERTGLLKTLSNEGSVSVYVQQENGKKSNEVKIEVVDKEKQKQLIQEAEDKKIADEQRIKEEEAKLAQENEAKEQVAKEQAAKEQAAKEQVAKEQQSTQTNNSQNQGNTVQTNQKNVYVPKTGKKYHSKASCSNMKNPSYISLDDAIARGFDACSKCY